MPKPWLLILFYMLTSPLVFSSNIEAKKSSPLEIKSALNNSNNLILATGIFDPKYDSLDFSAQNLVDTTLFNYGIVQFENLAADYDWLNEQGFNVVQSLSGNAYLVNWSHADKHLLEQNPNIRWFGPYKSGYKVSPLLWKSNRPNSLDFVFSISGFKDVINQDYKALISKYIPYAAIVNTNQPKNSGQITVSIKANKVDEALNVLSSLESIQWIAPYHAEKFFNTEAVSAIQASSTSGGNSNNNNYIPINTPIWDHGLYGSSQILGIADSGLDRNEDWFVSLDKGNGIVRVITAAQDVIPPALGTVYPNNKVFAYWTMPGAEAYDNGTYHGTHTTGSMAGDRSLIIDSGPSASVSSPTSSGYDNDDGMAPNAQILFNDIGSTSGLTGVGSKPMWEQAFAAGAAIHSNSYGASTLGSYVSSDSRADEALRELDDMIILFAAGNDDGQVNSTSSPGNAKNVITVGALLHGNNPSVANFSNKGPTDDGRLKPDISATGSSISSAAGNSNNGTSVGSPARRITSGTSMSTPITAGATALLRQYFTDGFFPTGAANIDDKHTPSGTLMKALLLNGTSTDGGFFQNNIGWGRVWLENSLPFSEDTKRFRFWELTNANGLMTNEQFTVTLPVNTGIEFRATLVWYDLPGPVGSAVTLVNNLDLSVSIAGGSTYLANNFVSNNSTSNGSSDNINTVEQVRFSNPSSGQYTITVDAKNIPGDGSFNSNKQGFALVVSGDLRETSNIPANPVPPTSLQATTNVNNNVSLSWTDVSVDYDSYEIYRVEGSCASADLTAMRYVGQSNSNNFIDTTTTGGFTYSYKVRAFSGELISSYTNCADVVSTDMCNLPPSFDSASTQIVSNTGSGCQIQLQWQNATSNCPASSTVNYNVYRSTNHNFIASNGTLLTTVPSNQYLDNFALLANTPYYYIVKAEDTTTNGEGPNNGNLSVGSYEIFSSALGLQTSEGQLIDDVDNLALMRVDDVWSVSNERASNGSLSYRSTQEGNTTYTSNTCGRMYSQEFSIAANPANNATIAYKTRYDIETDWDGVVVEISNDGGNSWSDLPPVGGYPNDFSSTGNPPINVCGYPQSQGAFNGSTNGLFQNITHNLSAYHGQTVQIRWSFSSDPGSEEEGFYLDELSYNNILVPQSCTIQNDLIFLNGFE